MKHKKPTPTGSRIIRDGEETFVSQQVELQKHVKKTHQFNLTIDNENFLLEKSKEKLVNMLVDLYYNKIFDSEIIDSPVQEQVLANIREIMESDHTHNWDYVDKGGHMEADGYILRFVCELCGLYKRIRRTDAKRCY